MLRTIAPRLELQVWLSMLALLAPVNPTAVAGASGVVLTNLQLVPNGGVAFDALGPAGMVYSLQASSNLRDWRTVDFASASTNRTSFQDASSRVFGPRYYRVRMDAPASTVTLTNYHAWTDSLVISNGTAEVVVVPAVGRIMQFQFLGSTNGPFWENPLLFGQQPSASSWNTAGSFGGDKAWPAPQSAWGWPPPRAFDSMSFTGQVTGGSVTLAGPVDPSLGTRVVRRIDLHPAEPIMRVTTRFEKVTGGTNTMGVWGITQVRDPERLFVPMAAPSIFPNGYTVLTTAPKGLALTNGLISLVPDTAASSKIGMDGASVLWVGETDALLIESPRVPNSPATAYPDQGSSVEVYTNVDPRYMELELLGPVVNLAPTQAVERTSIYTLFRRTQPDAQSEAQRILGLNSFPAASP